MAAPSRRAGVKVHARRFFLISSKNSLGCGRPSRRTVLAHVTEPDALTSSSNAGMAMSPQRRCHFLRSGRGSFRDRTSGRTTPFSTREAAAIVCEHCFGQGSSSGRLGRPDFPASAGTARLVATAKRMTSVFMRRPTDPRLGARPATRNCNEPGPRSAGRGSAAGGSQAVVFCLPLREELTRRDRSGDRGDVLIACEATEHDSNGLTRQEERVAESSVKYFKFLSEIRTRSSSSSCSPTGSFS